MSFEKRGNVEWGFSIPFIMREKTREWKRHVTSHNHISQQVILSIVNYSSRREGFVKEIFFSFFTRRLLGALKRNSYYALWISGARKYCENFFDHVIMLSRSILWHWPTIKCTWKMWGKIDCCVLCSFLPRIQIFTP